MATCIKTSMAQTPMSDSNWFSHLQEILPIIFRDIIGGGGGRGGGGGGNYYENRCCVYLLQSHD